MSIKHLKELTKEKNISINKIPDSFKIGFLLIEEKTDKENFLYCIKEFKEKRKDSYLFNMFNLLIRGNMHLKHNFIKSKLNRIIIKKDLLKKFCIFHFKLICLKNCRIEGDKTLNYSFISRTIDKQLNNNDISILMNETDDLYYEIYFDLREILND